MVCAPGCEHREKLLVKTFVLSSNLVYINDLPDVVKPAICACLLMMLKSPAHTSNQQCHNLQKHLDRIMAIAYEPQQKFDNASRY